MSQKLSKGVSYGKINSLEILKAFSINSACPYLPKVCWVAQHVHIKELRHISATVCIVFLSEGRADSSTLFLDHLTLLCLGPCCPDSPDQLPQSDRSWHSLENIKKRNRFSLVVLGLKLHLTKSNSEKLHLE